MFVVSMHGLLQGKWQSLCEAADAYSELSEYARKEKQWLLQRVSASLSFNRPGHVLPQCTHSVQCSLIACMQRVDAPLPLQGSCVCQWQQGAHNEPPG